MIIFMVSLPSSPKNVQRELSEKKRGRDGSGILTLNRVNLFGRIGHP